MEHVTDWGLEVQRPKISRRDPKVEWELSFEDYRKHSDHISSSGLKTLLTESPEHFLHAWNNPTEDTDAFRFGRIFHMAALEPDRFRSEVVTEPEFVGLTKTGKPSANCDDARNKRAAWREANKGKTFLSEGEQKDLTGMLKSVMKVTEARRIIEAGKPEASFFCTDPVTGLLMKARTDIVCPDLGVIADFKTTRSAATRNFNYDAGRFRYDIQMAFYKMAVELVLGVEIKGAAFIAVEKTPPYSCVVHEVNLDDIRNLSEPWVRHGLNVLKDCVEKDLWPGYSSRVEQLQIPKFVQDEPLPQFEFRNAR
jgi:PDDEXK-like domain of unknown function (DUF3799)